MKEKITRLRTMYERRIGTRNKIEADIEATAISLKNNKRKSRQYEQARQIVREVGIRTQQKLQYHISDITSLALEAVFENPYKLVAEFVERRNKTECDLLFGRGDNFMKPVDASGGGTVDVGAFALRVASWSMQSPRSRNTIILDEPLGWLSRDNQEKASAMIQEISKKLGVQFIIVTHEDTLTEHADKVFTVTQKKGISKISSYLNEY